MDASADIDDVLTVEDRDLRVEKTFDTETFDQELAVRFTITSSHNEPLTIKLIDQVPEGISPGGFGFLPNFHDSSWSIYNETYPTFDHTIKPGETIETMYAVGNYEAFPIDAFLQDPQIVEANPNADTSSGLSDFTDETDTEELEDTDNDSEDGPETRDATLEESFGRGTPDEEEQSDTAAVEDPDPADALESEELTDQPEQNETQIDESDDDDTEDPLAMEDADVTHTPPDSSTDTETTSDTDDSSPLNPDSETDSSEPTDTTDSPSHAPANTSQTESLTAELVAELENDTISEETKQALATELQPYLTLPADDARITSLQNAVADLEAYTEALEQFLNETGTADEISDRLDTIDKQLNALDDRVGALEAADLSAKQTPDNIDELRSDLEELQKWRDSLSQTF